MRFIVDLFRLIILAALAISLIGGTYAILKVWTSTSSQELTATAIAIFFGAAILVIVSLGILATAISAHDRLADIADHLERLVDRGEAHQGDGPSDWG